MATLLPNGEQTFFDADGNPLSLGSVYFYIPSTTTNKNTWQDSGQTILNTNPVVLDIAGRAIIYGSGTYRQVVKDALGNTVWDQITADTSSGSNSWSGTSGGTANAQTVTATNFTSTDGQSIDLIFGFTNLAALTLNPNGTGPINVLKDTIAGSISLTGGEAVAGNLGRLVYSSATGAFHLTSYPLDMRQPLTNLASAATTNLGTIASRNVNITGTTGVTAFGSSASTDNPLYFIKFAGALTLTYNATSMILPGLLDIVTAANDTAFALYLGSGNWQIVSYTRASGRAVQSVLPAGSFRALKVSVSSTTAATTTADMLVLEDASGNARMISAVSQAIATGTSGAGGLDTGAIANTTWYAVWIIAKQDGTVSSIISTSATAPTMPSGYTYKARVGWLRTDGAAALLTTIQYGRNTQYATIRSMISGTSGSTTVPTWTAQSVSNFVPTTAARIHVVGNTNAIGAVNQMMAAPNNTYGAYTSTTNPPPITVGHPSTGLAMSVPGTFTLESTNVYYASAAANAALYCMGWEDNL